MQQTRLAPLVGIAGSLGAIAVFVYPYLATDGPVGAYYGSGVVNPLVAGLLAAVTIIVFAAGRAERTPPDLAAGAALVFGAFAAVIVLAWALTVRVDVLEVAAIHPWVALAVSAVIPIAGLWYAWSLGLL